MQIKTDISLAFQKTLKKRGYLFASIGSLFLFIGANVLTVQTLEKVGLWLFLTAIVFIYLGLKPYSEAKKRIMFPDFIQIEEKSLNYIQNEKIILSLPIPSITKIAYQDKTTQYGILISTTVKDKSYFLPYFSKSAFETLLLNSALQNIVHSK